MFSHLTDWELIIYGFVIAIFTIAPLPLFPDRHPQPKPIFHLSQLSEPKTEVVAVLTADEPLSLGRNFG